MKKDVLHIEGTGAKVVIPAKAGIQAVNHSLKNLDSRLRHSGMTVVLRLSIGLLVCSGVNLGAIQVTPTYQIIPVQPGKKVTASCQVVNNEEEKITVSLSAKDWFVLPENEKFKATEWLTFPKKQFTLQKGESKKIQFKVEAPKGAQGELVGMLSFGVVGETPSDVNKVLSVATYVAVSGTEKLKGILKAITVTQATESVNVTVTLLNEGNIHVRPIGWMEVLNSKNELVNKIYIKQGRPTYPGREGVYTGQLNGPGFPKGTYQARVTFVDVDRQQNIFVEMKTLTIGSNNTVEIK